MGTRFTYNPSTRFTGRITSAAPFSLSSVLALLCCLADPCAVASGSRNYIAVGCQSGIYVATRGESPFRKVLSIPNAISIVALQLFNRFLVHFEHSLLSYSLDLMARCARGESLPSTLDASKEEIAGPGGDGNVLFFRVGIIGGRTMSE